ncbi:GIY-YIG nuclease family protein [Streptomyces chartreusis]|uniref:hypothetical protein n=1 Tax=Streptomyces chartreusis TaxID=1969 RepID=UPI00380D459F
MIQTQRKAAVYRLYAADGTLLYIGSAYDPEGRCKAHRKLPWWPLVARRAEEWFESRGGAYRAEMKAIAAEGSQHNAMGTPSYRTPDTPAVRERKLLASLRQKLVEESWQVEATVRRERLADGVPRSEAERAGQLAAVDFLDDTGLFAGAVKVQRRRLAAEE